MAVKYDMADRLFVAAPIALVAVTALSRFEGWDLCSDIVCRLRVTSAAAGAGDSLIVVVQHSLDRSNWSTLATFSTVAGNVAVPYTEVKSVGKGAGTVAWGPWLRCVATPAGISPSFVIGDLRIIGS